MTINEKSNNVKFAIKKLDSLVYCLLLDNLSKTELADLYDDIKTLEDKYRNKYAKYKK
jgi:hypothetical protein